ncbi:hypothetical protein E1B28_012475 [Marasmius oreades]|uniref:Uncharacterized protein n=1 Tax=Marasmius oreades TaxID=181124 RepID=A0A9P7UNA1_9AGAR|nr:uncharacterized protein E1B28_012475 [Marasmius oreades]KAG7088487.1 hypothetical protein E1B28_012475 [Marasmius oreades]
MVRICTTVVGVLVALASFSVSKPVAIHASVADVQADFATIRNVNIPRLNNAIANLPDSPDEVKGPEVAEVQRATAALSSKMIETDGHVKDVPSVDRDEAEMLLTSMEVSHRTILGPIDAIAAKSGTFTGKEAPLRPLVRREIVKLKVNYVQLADDLLAKTPDDMKPRGEVLKSDAVQHFDNAINEYN